MSDNLICKDEWDIHYVDVKLSKAHKKDPIRMWLEKYIERGDGTCFEIGCFPGRYLSVFGDLGYNLNGIDLTSRILELPDWLKKNNYKSGIFSKIDFFEYNPTEKYDIVCSFGFIEHFVDWQNVLKRQADFVKNGGYLIVLTPNFIGTVQNFLHRYLDRPNYNRHYLPAMNPYEWVPVIKESNYNIVSVNYIGKFDFWIDKKDKNFFDEIFLKTVVKFFRLFLPPDNKVYSPFCGLIAKKNIK